MREWLCEHGWILICVCLVVIVAFALYGVALSVFTQAQSNRYAICMATERFSAAECEYIANDLYMEMWRGELR